ncbi:Branched-chain amino acid transport ATP-binding protein LivG (TC 3.A.1.4.1) [Olavius algarvensis Delta 1 endosymbiont]|nr:Branched-chain amino acid transport ATP-binding protein LivG (TC 3.A.1.4.1) [Olavius algarvensis Delta 1 endosymbiont]
MADLLVCEGLTKTFGRLLAVDDVSFSITEGQIKGVAGPNGAGKTTIFNIITGLPYRATGGKIVFAGREIQNTPPHAICHQGIARTFQKETVFDTLSVFENVLVAASYGRTDQTRRNGEDKAAEIIEFVGLGDLGSEQATHLTLFEKKKLMLAQALATNPRLLLLDEPASGLNNPEMEESAALFRRINERGVSILLIEHKLPLLLSLSESVLILNYGQKLVEGPPDTVIKDERVIEAYLGKRR